MTSMNVGWGSPEAIGRLTIPQLICLISEKPPAPSGRTFRKGEGDAALKAIEADAAERERYERAWRGEA